MPHLPPSSNSIHARSPRRALLLTTFGISIVLMVGLGEILLRVAGRLPWKHTPSSEFSQQVNRSTMYEPDSTLAWKNKPGTYTIQDHSSNTQQKIAFTFLPGGRRSTGAADLPNRRTLTIVGGSFTMGYGISDHETYPWKLQSRFPNIQIVNYGTSAYGTYQSLLTLEKIFSESPPPQIVLYGFIEHHEDRNVGTPAWLKTLARHSGGKYDIGIPYVTINTNGNLTRHSFESYPRWPLRESLATVTFAQDLFLKWRNRNRAPQKRNVTEKLLVEMNTLCQHNQAKLFVVLLSMGKNAKSHYKTFLQHNHINFLDCVYPMTPERRLSDDWHPNGTMNSLWANCIGEAMSDVVSKISTS